MSAQLPAPDRTTPILITGGAGFIGVNLAHRLLTAGYSVRVFDSLVRPGVRENLRWLRATHPQRLEIQTGDVRDAAALGAAVKDTQHIFHFAAQVAVTTSLLDPREDFAINAGGTLNLLEAARAAAARPGVTFASTNKVYGALDDIALVSDERRYSPADAQLRAHGIGETRPLEFHSPYGCSKGAAEQYVLDYARTFGMANTVLRMSCIYGPHQQGNSDQGWVAHFLRCGLTGEPLTLYGDGRQVRDLLFIDDFTAALERVLELRTVLAGRAFNLGGGVRNTASLRELIEIIETAEGRALTVSYGPWRDADQRYYVSDTTRFREATGWRPRVGVPAGVRALAAWMRQRAPHDDREAAPPRREAAALREGLGT
jgi:CDP-paratose 2-epimerase